MPTTDRDLFRGYDIRGIAGVDLTPAITEGIGRAFGRHVVAGSGGPVFVGRDGRPSGVALAEAVVDGLTAAGADVLELGIVPTPIVYFASAQRPGSFGVSVTASHLAADWNGLKFCQGSLPIHTDLVRAWMAPDVEDAAATPGERRSGRDKVLADYALVLRRLLPGANHRSIVIDAQNGAASRLAAELFVGLGMTVDAIHDDAGRPYPFDTPDPQVAGHLEPLRTRVLERGATLGFAFDGDADRLGVVDESGRRLSSDLILALLAEDVLRRRPGEAIVYDVLMSPVVEEVTRRSGGTPIEAPSGHAYVQDRIRETAAPLGGEGSGHFFFADAYRGPALGYDDAMYAAARLVEYVLRVGPLGVGADALPAVVASEEWRPACPDGLKRVIVEEVMLEFRASGVIVSDIDGAKAHFGRLSWALVRAANTEPALSVRVVGPTLEAVQTRLAEVIAVVRRIAAQHGVTLPDGTAS